MLLSSTLPILFSEIAHVTCIGFSACLRGQVGFALKTSHSAQWRASRLVSRSCIWSEENFPCTWEGVRELASPWTEESFLGPTFVYMKGSLASAPDGCDGSSGREGLSLLIENSIDWTGPAPPKLASRSRYLVGGQTTHRED